MPCEPIPLGEFLLENRRFPAVYFLFHRGVVVYVGQSKTLKFLIDQHLEEGVKGFDAVAFISCSVDQLTKIEARYIRKLAPKYNSCATAKKARERHSWHPRGYIPGRNVRYTADPAPAADAEFVDAAHVFVDPRDLGDFLGVTDSDAAEWRDGGEIKDMSIIGLLHFVADNNRKIRKAQDRFEDL